MSRQPGKFISSGRELASNAESWSRSFFARCGWMPALELAAEEDKGPSFAVPADSPISFHKADELNDSRHLSSKETSV
jgi:hypothetical protein